MEAELRIVQLEKVEEKDLLVKAWKESVAESQKYQVQIHPNLQQCPRVHEEWKLLHHRYFCRQRVCWTEKDSKLLEITKRKAQVHLPLVEKSTMMVVEDLHIREKRGTFEILGIWRMTWELGRKEWVKPIKPRPSEMRSCFETSARGCFATTHV